MIEFTISRVVLAVSGIVLLGAAMGVLASTGDDLDMEMDSESVKRFASMLDSFDGSVMTELVLEGYDHLPTEEHMLRVSEHVVTLSCENREHHAYTSSDLEFSLDWWSVVSLRKSVPEGFGDGTDGVRENVDLLHRVVQVG